MAGLYFLKIKFAFREATSCVQRDQILSVFDKCSHPTVWNVEQNEKSVSLSKKFIIDF